MLLKIITNMLKKVLLSDEKNTQQAHHICCSGIEIDLRCNFIVDQNWPPQRQDHFVLDP